MFGDPTFKEHKLTVPAGRYAVVLAQITSDLNAC